MEKYRSLNKVNWQELVLNQIISIKSADNFLDFKKLFWIEFVVL